MRRLPLFPLPQTVVFPGLLIPLYIFEERYKQMVRHLLAQGEERRFVITLATAAGIREVGGYVELLAASENPDGTFNILCRGGERCRVEGVGVLEPHLYHTTLDIPFPLERAPRSEEIVAAWDALETFRSYMAGLADPKALEAALANLPDDPLYQATFLCANLRVSPLDKQALLEAPSLLARLELAQTLMRQGPFPNHPAEA
ncbi:peptidase S16 [Meiothermus sp. QL-1]|uniref:LON peptidase substrate-binding domain-containing protein n=1 Tax=Meiothermus sp. QL-1 TaxID=2058095 RepID=UPI000E0C52C0|nr:LON peptidase substrate-binding domain-containing protein [Meiothermus sp. QL-1]RDI95493.1 peptidase S16 [Meiothermus sp. QL-1]